MNKACAKLFQNNKNPSDEDMREIIYSELILSHSEEIEKINNTKDGWNGYWTEVLQTQVNCLFIFYYYIYKFNY